jgi:hypothetical protein
MGKFDVNAAKQAGYSDSEIVEHLGKQSSFDVAGARASGYDDAALLQHLTAAPKVAPVEAEKPGVGETLLIGAGRTFDRIGKGMSQIKNSITGDTKAAAALKEQAAEEDRIYAGLQKQRPVLTAVGEALPSLAVPVGTGATLAGAVAKTAAASAIPAALEYGTVEERARKAAGAGIGGTVGGVLVPKVGTAAVQGGKALLKNLTGEVTPAAVELMAKAQAHGIPVNAAQLTDGRFLKILQSTLEQMPLAGGGKIHKVQQEGFNKAVAKTFGDDATNVVNADVYATNKKRLGATFEDITSRNNLKIDDPLLANLDGIVKKVGEFGDDSTVKSVNSAYARVLKQAQDAPEGLQLPGKAYQSLDRELGEIQRAGGEKSIYIKEFRETLRNAMDGSITQVDKAAWDKARGEYKNLKAVRDVVARNGAEGNVSPAQLLASLNRDGAGKEAMATGNRGTLGELAQIGERFVRDKVPNSGTAQRTLAMGALGGGGYMFGADPSTIGAMLVGGTASAKVIEKILASPRVIEAMSRQGLSSADVMKLPPAAIQQILGGIGGQATLKDILKEKDGANTPNR